MKINMIAAVGKNLELGRNNKLIWHISEDMEFFKKMTIGKTVVMGEATYNSIGKALPFRNNVVLSYDRKSIPSCLVLNDYKDVFKLDCDEIFIIGGASIYKLFLPYSDNLYLTEIEDVCDDCDCYFPSFDKGLYDRSVIFEGYDFVKYSFVCYKRKGNVL